MTKWCFNFESGEYEDIDKDGYSWTKGEYVYNWDDSEYRQEEEEALRRLNDETAINAKRVCHNGTLFLQLLHIYLTFTLQHHEIFQCCLYKTI